MQALQIFTQTEIGLKTSESEIAHACVDLDGQQLLNDFRVIALNLLLQLDIARSA